MHTVSTLRLNVLRAAYALIAVGMGSMIWPLILQHPAGVARMTGVVWSMLGAITLFSALLGIRYPLKMLPLLLIELAWKTIWVLSFGLPLWLAGQLDAATAETLKECLFGVVLVPLVLPWGYVWTQYVRAPGDRWRGQASAPVVPPNSSVVAG
ncbi:MAG TPA: hypothetical protein VFT45_02560 [Longimicrobium sp.]|nr:hypothetical protein [Longimicrobium sp.]